ncbi:hypothetical protein IFM89_006342 [Coptis chinensis]|uniref:DUF4220 domain-containing protein n=1 Tax=Coptis chinensis TaxID=261450 RepID=A0A835M775_9MAGN|nr:hypothetical protein IFM89_006342 [Coptis chinensis]
MEIPKRVKMIWGDWSIRLFILLSLFSQIVLVLLAPLRKKKQQNRIARFIWLVYLLADWVAIFTLGLLSNNQNDDSSGLNGRDDLLALWAPFLLLHLGGPDTITAFALEDNELWLRHLIGLIYQLIPAGYVFIRSFPTNTLLVPTIFIFPVGIVKYVERTLSLYGASFDALNTECMNPMRGSGLKIFRFGQDFVDVNGQGWEDQVTSTKILQYAYYLFHNFKGIVADHMLNLFHLIKSREVFLMWSANDAFKVIEIELSFLYEMLYTKAVVVHSRVGYVFRFICFIFITIALCDFFFLKKHKFHESDIKITYTLLIGAVSLEATGLFNLIFSDWSVIHLTNSQSGVASFIVKYHKLLF